MNSKPVVAVAMSGGVDSSATAALLVERGYHVFGLMLNLWSEPDAERTNRCCTPDAVSMARKVAAILSIPLYVLDARQIFFDSVVKPFIDDYTHNRTPNPCIACNRLIRWGFLLDHARAAGADFMATGHYARLIQNSSPEIQLWRGVDPTKDQSYVLHVLTQDKLAHTLFPLGDYTKQEVRQMASAYGLPVAERPDSQDLCFIGGSGDYRGFLRRYAPQAQNPGSIIDRHGTVLGQHQGLANFTIGQRKGIRVASPSPLYVLDKDFTQNKLIVGSIEQSGRTRFVADRANWISGQPPASTFSSSVKVRYNSRDISGVVNIMDDNKFRVEFENRVRDIAPGQAAVLYNGDICIGGGRITN